MKKVILLFCLSLSLGFSASALSLRDVVLGEDFSEPPTMQMFPCSAYIDVVHCQSKFLILEPRCQKTLKIDARGLTCQTLKGDLLTFAKVIPGSKFDDSTMAALSAYRLNFSPRVSLRELKTPNGNLEYQLIVN